MAVKLYIKKNNIIFLRLQTINYICSEIEMLSVLFRTKKQMGDVSEERKRGYSKPWSLSSHRKTAFPILCSAPQCSAPPPPPTHTRPLLVQEGSSVPQSCDASPPATPAGTAYLLSSRAVILLDLPRLFLLCYDCQLVS